MQTKIFDSDLKAKAEQIVANYEQKRAALLPVLHLVQEAHGFISAQAEREAADFFGIPLADMKEVMTFYTLFRSRPCAKHQFNVCRTLSCSLLGSGEILEHLKRKLGIGVGEQTEDGKFALNVVECLGACEMAPMMQVNGEYVGALTAGKINEILRNADESQ